MTKYIAGQRWSYQTRQQDDGSTLLIGKVQESPGQPTIIRVMVEGIVAPHSNDPIMIGHMPFAESAIDKSVLELV